MRRAPPRAPWPRSGIVGTGEAVAVRAVELREERPGALADLDTWLDEHGWFDAGLVRRGARAGRYEVDEAYLDFFLEQARGLGLRLVR